jgi:hypothetical protein
VPAFSRERLVGDIDALYQRLIAERDASSRHGRAIAAR